MSKLIRDYLDLIHIYRSPIVGKFPKEARKNLIGTGIADKLFRSLKAKLGALKSTISFSRNQKKYAAVLPGKNWLFVLGHNNYRSISFLENELPQSVYVTPYQFSIPEKEIIKLELPQRLWKMFLHSWLFIPLLFRKAGNVIQCWDVAFASLGLIDSYQLLLQKFRPESIIFSNDHTLDARALLKAAVRENIPTFYIQHACIRPDFPPLLFDLSLLEGDDAREKYMEIAPPRGEIEMIGLPRMDPYIHEKNTSDVVRRVGLCSNLLDDVGEIRSTLDHLKSKYGDVTFTYRPHPSDNRLINFSLAGIKVSDAKKENVFEFLKKQDLIIAGNTSIHYEAVSLNVVSIYTTFNSSGVPDDIYGFVKRGLVEQAKDFTQLEELISKNVKEKEEVRSKASFYNAVLNTNDEGKSAALASRHIKENLKLRKTQAGA